MSSQTIVATGASSGLGFEALRQALQSAPGDTSYRVILGCRNVAATKAAYDALRVANRHTLIYHTLELSKLDNVKVFASQVLADLAEDSLDVLLLSAGINKAATSAGVGDAATCNYCEAFIVNYAAQQYLMLLLESKLIDSHARVVVVTSMLYKKVTDTSSLEQTVSALSRASAIEIYESTKFIQLASLQEWRKRVGEKLNIIAVSPGFVPETNLSRETSWLGRLFMYYIMPYALFATSLKDGGAAICRATLLDLSQDGQQDVYQNAVLDKKGNLEPVTDTVLQKHVAEKWFLSIQDIENL